ncbi:MAG: serine/threonine-protein kinase, partial [Pseudarthrobacter sp.]
MRDDDFTRDLQPGDTCGPYQIGRLLDEGGFSVVYAGENTIIKRPAALKILKPERDRVEDIVERFAREIELLAKIDHENVVRFYETGYARGRLWLAMELLDGLTLRKHILAGRRFRLEEALRIGYEIACGVAQAQSLGVIHRDLKPENVILTEATVVKVLDFGIAKFNGQGLQSTGRHPLGVMGTPSYMSPEQILGEAVTFASDVYQVAVIIYELVAGQHPFANRRGELP